MCYIKRVPPVSPFALAFAFALAPSSPLPAAPRRAAPRPLPCVLPLMYPTHREPTMRRDPCTTRPKSPALPVYLPACLPACRLAGLPACLRACLACSLACVRLSAPPACLRCSACLRRSRFARENRSLLKYIGEYEERPRRVAGRSTSWEMALTRVIEGENRREGGE